MTKRVLCTVYARAGGGVLRNRHDKEEGAFFRHKKEYLKEKYGRI